MKNAGVEVVVYDQHEQKAPDSIFPDWFTIQRGNNIPDGVFTIFPMLYPSRRMERNPKIIEDLKKSAKHFIDLTGLEKENEFLEGKGSVIYDHRNNKLYICNSQRATLKAIEIYVKELNKISKKPWKAVVFTGKDDKGSVIYHTDCMLTIMDKHAMVCTPALTKEQKDMVIAELSDPKLNEHPYKIIEISMEEVQHMCCNLLNVTNKKSENVLLMSRQASENYTKEHMELLSANYRIVASDVNTIEKQGGGSTRCLLAEYF